MKRNNALDAWSMSRLFHQCSEPGYYIEDCQIFRVDSYKFIFLGCTFGTAASTDHVCLVVIFYIVLTVVKLFKYRTGQSSDILWAVVRQLSANHKAFVRQLSGNCWSVVRHSSGRIICSKAKNSIILDFLNFYKLRKDQAAQWQNVRI